MAVTPDIIVKKEFIEQVLRDTTAKMAAADKNVQKHVDRTKMLDQAIYGRPGEALGTAQEALRTAIGMLDDLPEDDLVTKAMLSVERALDLLADVP